MRRNHKNHIGSPCRPVSAFPFQLTQILIQTVANCLLQNMHGFTRGKFFCTVALTCLKGGGFDPL